MNFPVTVSTSNYTMNDQNLLEVGFEKFTPSRIDNYDLLFQYKVTDEIGIKYFINVTKWDMIKLGGDHIGWQVELCFNDGANWHQPSCLRVIAGNIEFWKVQDVLDWADEVWQRLKPHYYELT